MSKYPDELVDKLLNTSVVSNSKYPAELSSKLLKTSVISIEFFDALNDLREIQRKIFTYDEAMAAEPGTLFVRTDNTNDLAVRTHKGLYWAESRVDPDAHLEENGTELLFIKAEEKK